MCHFQLSVGKAKKHQHDEDIIRFHHREHLKLMKYLDAIGIYLDLAMQVFYNVFYDDILFICDVPTIKKADSQHSLHQNDEDPLVEQEDQQSERERKRSSQNKTASSF
jgi:hypothetical protein